MSKLDIGARRNVNVYDGHGGDCWIPGTVIDFDDGDMREGKAPAVIFQLDRPDWQGSKVTVVRLPWGGSRLRPEERAA